MKKTLLIVALTLVGAHALQSMQPQPQQSGYWNYLPQNVQQTILQYQSYWNLLPNGVKEYIMSYFATTPSNNASGAINNTAPGALNRQQYPAYPNANINTQPALNYNNTPSTNTTSSGYDQIKAWLQDAMNKQ